MFAVCEVDFPAKNIINSTEKGTQEKITLFYLNIKDTGYFLKSKASVSETSS